MKHTEVKTPRLAAGPLGPAPSGPDLPVAMVLGRDSGNRSLSMSLLFSNISIQIATYAVTPNPGDQTF